MGTKKESMNKYKPQKVYTYFSQKDIERLRRICKNHEFGSIYHLLQYLGDCFLRVVDPQNDDNNEPVPHAIEEIFISPKEYHRIKRIAKKKKDAKHFEIQLLIPFGEFLNKRTKKLIINEQGLKIADEIKEIFEDNTDWEAEPDRGNSYYEGMNIKKKMDQRKIKSPNDLK